MPDLSLTVTDSGDSELTAMAFVLLALRGLDANAAARVAHYLVERYPRTDAS